MSEYYIVGVRIDEERPTYCYSSVLYKAGDKVVAEVDSNQYLGTVANCRKAEEKENLEAYWEISRPAAEEDISQAEDIKKRDLEMVPVVQKEADSLNLRMSIFRIQTSLDKAKSRVMYTSDERVDFRNLLRVLAQTLKARIEMRQVGPRDKAKMVGGLGICGLKLCCSTFLNAFEGITIAMAKNQMLAINIPKLSGQCGKLICCLKYEDEAYEDAKKGFPRPGTSLKVAGNMMKVNSINVLNKTINLYGGEGTYQTITLDEYNKILNPAPVVAPTKPAYTPASTNSNPAYQQPTRHFEQNRPNNNNYQSNNRNQNNRPNNNYQGNNSNIDNNHNNNQNNGNYHNNNNRNNKFHQKNNNKHWNNPRPNNNQNVNNNNKQSKPAAPSNPNYQGETRPGSDN